MNQVENIYTQAMQLDCEQRSRLIDRLLASFETGRPASYDEAWGREIQKRIKELDEGTVETIEAAEATRKVREELRRTRENL